MDLVADSILVFVLLTDFALLGTSQLSACIRQVAVQGVVLGLLPLLAIEQGMVGRFVVLAAVIGVLKGIVFPKLLLRSLRLTNVRRESAPIIGHTASMVAGIAIVIGAFWLSSNLPLPTGERAVSDLVLPVGLATLLSGLLLIVSRRLALMQVLGFLVLENGIFVFGVGLAHEEPLLVEMGILLDVFLAVLVMGVAVFHISRTFDDIDVDRFSELKDM